MMSLYRTEWRDDGIFSDLSFDSDPGLFCVTLEHSYGGKPKVLSGVYTCVRGVHQLEHGGPFETFEITSVPGHSGILFHVGNFNRDSNGCVLLGSAIAIDPTSGDKMVIHSRETFSTFMQRLVGINSFQLRVI